MIGRDSGADGSIAHRRQLLDAARDTVLGHLSEALEEVLNRADDMLFEFAEKSDSNLQQARYFDAMQELRLKRAEIKFAFEGSFIAGFEQRCRRRPIVVSQDRKSGFSTVAEAATDEDAAIAALSDRMTRAAPAELAALNKRVAVLLGMSTLASDDNPIGPACIACALRQTCDGLAIDGKSRLILFKLLDRQLASTVGIVFAATNQQLVEQDVLRAMPAELRPEWTRDIGADTMPGGSSVHLAAQADSGGIVQPLAGRNAGESEAGNDNSELSPRPCSPELIVELNRLQRSSPAVNGGIGGASAGRLKQIKRGIPGLDAASEMTIDVIDLMFEYLLDDERIPESVRALIARLQVPALKVALIDRSFFSKEAHPARRLMNIIAEAAIAAAGDRDWEAGVLCAVEQIVRRILSELDLNVQIFADCMIQLDAALESLKHEASTRAAHTGRLLDGRARLEFAKDYVREAVETRLRPEGVPEAVRNFLLTHWKHLLITLHARDGEDRSGFNSAMRTMDELVWSVLPRPDAHRRDRLIRLLPRLLVRLKQGMEAVSMPPVARSGFLNRLAEIHAEIIRVPARRAAAAEGPQQGQAEEQLVSERKTSVPNAAAGESHNGAIATLVPPGARRGGDSEPPEAIAQDKRMVLAAIMRRLRNARELPPEPAAISPAEEAAPAATPSDDSKRGESQAQPSAASYERIPAEFRAAMHHVRTGPPELPAIELAMAPNTAEIPHWAQQCPGQEKQAPGVAGLVPERPQSDEADVEMAAVKQAPDAAATTTAPAQETQSPSLAELFGGSVQIEVDSNIVEVMPAQQPGAEATTIAPADESLLEMTANTFYRMFATGSGEGIPPSHEATFDVQELILGETAEAAPHQPDDEHAAFVKTLEPGTWIEFRREDGSKMRARFASYCATADTYRFTDRNGRKVADRTRNGMVTEFRRGSAAIVCDAPLLDRAFTRLMDTLNLAEETERERQ